MKNVPTAVSILFFLFFLQRLLPRKDVFNRVFLDVMGVSPRIYFSCD